MERTDHTRQIMELSASEGVFTTAQAARMGVPRDTLAKACAAGRLTRVAHGAYRLAGTPPTELDGLAAAWKLTAPAKMSHERASEWDGVCAAGATAAAVLGIGDFWLTPYRLLSPKRMRPRSPKVSVGTRRVDREDVSFVAGVPVTRPERTLVDLVLDGEEPSLVQGALREARSKGLDEGRLADLCSREGPQVASELLGEWKR